ncbi:DNA repair protein RadA [Vibrio ponticus]|nr:DNA repair protein RadA [Vibrio ponticus]
MAKAKRAYVCNDCGADFPRWQGQCSACGAWNTISEVRLAASPAAARNERLTGYAGSCTESQVQTLAEIDLQEVPRFTSGFKELDRVLGGGVVPGAAILIGGSRVRVSRHCCYKLCAFSHRKCRLCTSPVKNRYSKWRCAHLV